MEKRERIAGTITDSLIYDMGLNPTPELREGLKEYGQLRADKILAELKEAGFVVVPYAATLDMKIAVSDNWGRRTWEEYRRVLDAAQQKP